MCLSWALTVLCPEAVPGGGNECPGSGTATLPGPATGAAQELLPKIQELLSSQIKLCLHCNQSPTYCRHSMLCFCVCWVFLSAAGWEVPIFSVTWDAGGTCHAKATLPGLGDKQPSLLSYMDFRDIKIPPRNNNTERAAK